MTKIYSYHVIFDRREMVSMPPDKVPTDEEAMEQLYKALDGEVSSLKQRWNITQVIRMDEDGNEEYLVYDGSRWVTREEMECVYHE